MFWLHKYWKNFIPLADIVAAYIVTSTIGWVAVQIGTYACLVAYKAGKSGFISKKLQQFRTAKSSSKAGE